VTDTTTSPAADADQTAGRMRAIAAGLTDAGLDARVYETRRVTGLAYSWAGGGGSSPVAS
jgi:hypothetical protein